MGEAWDHENKTYLFGCRDGFGKIIMSLFFSSKNVIISLSFSRYFEAGADNKAYSHVGRKAYNVCETTLRSLNTWSVSYCSEYILPQQGSFTGKILPQFHCIRKSSCHSVISSEKYLPVSLYSKNYPPRRSFFFRKIPTTITFCGNHPVTA